MTVDLEPQMEPQEPVEPQTPEPAVAPPAPTYDENFVRFYDWAQSHPDAWNVLVEVEKEATDKGWDSVRNRLKSEPQEPDPYSYADPVETKIKELESKIEGLSTDRAAEREAQRAVERQDAVSKAWEDVRGAYNLAPADEQVLTDYIQSHPYLMNLNIDAVPSADKRAVVKAALEDAYKAAFFDDVKQQAAAQTQQQIESDLRDRRRAAAASGSRTQAAPASGPMTKQERRARLVDMVRQLRGESA